MNGKSQVDDSDAVIERLDRLIALLRLAYADRIRAARSEITADPVNAALLDKAADGWIAAGELTRSVMAATNQANSTVRARIAALVESEILARRGSAAKTEYRSTGLM